jgi:hypothetical protein
MMRIRRPKRGPESVLLRNAIASGVLDRSTGKHVDLVEPIGPYGFPDFIRVQLRRNFARMPGIIRLSSYHYRVLQQLFELGGRAGVGRIALLMNEDAREVRRALGKLQRSRLVFRAKSTFGISSIDRTFPARDIIAVEAKIDDWRKALYQAALNTWFATQSYVLLPGGRAVSAAAKQAKKDGIGLIVCEPYRCYIKVRARRTAPPASFWSWVLAHWAAQKIQRGHAKRNKHGLSKSEGRTPNRG